MMSRLDPEFTALLSPRFQLAELERHASSIFGLWPDLRLAYVNPAWVAFANGNCGQPSIDQKWGLGSHYLDAIAEPLRPFYVGLLDSSPDPQQSRAPVSHVYECSNAELYRTFRQILFRSETMEQGFESPLPHFIFKHADCIIFSFARMDHQRQSGFTCCCNVAAKAKHLRFSWRVIIVIIKAHFANADDLG